MSKIPTAEEFFNSKLSYNYEWTSSLEEMQSKIYNAMIEFTKLHVKEAVLTCIEEAPSGSSTDTVSYEDVVKALKDCYPLTNIK